jgi:hypothetical protein
MHCPTLASTALLLALSLAVAGVRAQQDAAEAPAAKAASAEAASKPAPPPRPKPTRRRSVQQIIEPTPRIVTDGYRPTLTTPAPSALPAPVPPPSGPVRMNSCDAGGCFDTNGARYNGGVGNTLIGPQGQLCTKGVVNAQCF